MTAKNIVKRPNDDLKIIKIIYGPKTFIFIRKSYEIGKFKKPFLKMS